jgi:hypothetical protein
VPSIVFYISGHGFGHSIRQIAVINALLAAGSSSPRIVVRTNAAPWLFDRTVRGPIAIEQGETDSGVVQIDGLRLDEEATIVQARAFYDGFKRRVQRETALLREHDAHLVIADAPPLACAAADAAGVPSVVCANFTWDWIYREYIGGSEATPLLTTIRHAYSRAKAAWRMPLHGGFESIARIVDIPFVARHARTDLAREEIRRQLGLPPDRPLALVSFGGYGLRDLPLHHLDCTGTWDIVITASAQAPAGLPRDIHHLLEDRMYASGLRYEDLVKAVDVVVTKPGYGIVSDCVANGAAMLYTSRGRFAEYDVMIREMPGFLRCRFIERDAFEAGRWKDALEGLAALPSPPERPRTDGAEVVARMILDAVSAP